MSRRPAVRRRNLLADLLRMVVSLVALLALLVALPIGLYVTTRALLPLGLASLGSPGDLLTKQDTGGIALLALAAIGWIGWAQFALSVLLEIPAQLRGRKAPKIRGFALSQRAAAGLVGGILILLPTAGGAFAATAAPTLPVPAQARVAATASAAAGQQGQGAGQVQSTAVQASSDHIYTVKDASPADSLWSIAEHQLGDGARWHEIAALNEGRTMPGGAVFRAAGDIQPGWQLYLPGSAAGAEGAAAQAAGAPNTVTVQAGETLSSIAERELGDAARYPELAQANAGHTMPDGRQMSNPDEIFPGWTITIPQTAKAAPPAAATPSTPAPATQTPAAQPPQSPAPATPAPAEQTPVAQQPAPSVPSTAPTTAPSTAPSAAPSTAPSTAPSAAPSTAPSTDPVASPSATAQTPTTTPAPAQSPAQPSASAAAPTQAASPSATTSAAPSASATAEAPQPAGPATASPKADAPQASSAELVQSSSSVDIAALATWGGLAAAGIVSALGLKRMLQQRGRRRGERIRMPQAAPAAPTQPAPVDPVAAASHRLSDLERRLRATEDPVGADLVDRALRTLAARLAEQGRPLPKVAAVLLTPTALDLVLLEGAEQPIAPFAPTADPTRWRCPAVGADLLDAESARHIVAPYPALATLGRDGNDLVLVDLETLGVLLLDVNDARPFVRALAVELASAPWRDDLGVLLAGLDDGLAQLDSGYGRLQPVGTLTEALTDLTSWNQVIRQALTDAGIPSVRHARTTSATPDSWTPRIAVSAVPLTTGDVADAGQLHSDPVCGALIAPAGRDVLPQVVRLPGLGGGPLTIGGFTLGHLVPQRITDEDFDALMELFGLTSEPSEAPAADETAVVPTAPVLDMGPVLPATVVDLGPVPPATVLDLGPVPPATVLDLGPVLPTTADEVVSGTADEAAHEAEEPVDLPDLPDPTGPVINVLGPVHLTGVDTSSIQPAASMRLTEVAAWIALHPGQAIQQLTVDLNPSDPNAVSSAGLVSALRRWLGSADDDTPHLPQDTGAGLRFGPHVASDWDRFLQLTSRGTHRARQQALALVADRPFADVPLRRYIWAEGYRQQIIAAVVDTAAQVAEHCLEVRDHRGALAAADTGIRVEAAAESLYRLAMQAAHLAGDRESVERYADRLEAVLEQLGAQMEPATSELLHGLLTADPRLAGWPS
ncbi:LysM peptidoglycan-binding domain-containing protein [Streptomyces kaniharaensis]|uniref:LysM peptidoglycan-binding domain-containing protein n=1 Tax=Streptomyces kaniharaensis TaxID=212423 RepID=A0A6N7L1A6_9ACTN|nr:LysM peptidoglycan-binding domain-containing protein [Streptomyces kaniharaensis]MQS16477.1 LysM peptidoglycan-binding domain-containing protein [Streptomyces kaniharaensis]